MGIEPDAPARRIATLGRLGPEIEWVQLDHIPLGEYDLRVRHEDANRKTTLKNNSTEASLTWEARFPGSYKTLLVDGKPHPARKKSINGVEVSYVEVAVPAGRESAVVAGSSKGSPQHAATR